MRARHWHFPPTIILALVLCCLQQSAAANCVLTPINEQLQIAELHTDEWRPNEPKYTEKIYRKRLLRFVNAYYSNIAEDLLRGEGEYLIALERLMGSSNKQCVSAYKALLLQEVNSHDFGIALWTLRMPPATQTQTWAASTCQDCEVSERIVN